MNGVVLLNLHPELAILNIPRYHGVNDPNSFHQRILGAKLMIRRILPQRIALLACCFILATTCSTAFALPPLGLTQISSQTNVNSGLEVIDGTAYLNVSNGIWTVDSLGTKTFTQVVPTPASLVPTTPVVKATDGELYFVANYGPYGNSESTLFQFGQTLTPVVTFGQALTHGVDSQLRMFDAYGAIFLSDGSFDGYLETPVGSIVEGLDSSTPKGYVLGTASIPNTLGTSPALWNPDGSFSSFLYTSGFVFPGSIRDRADGNGVNISDGDSGQVILGGNGYGLTDANGTPLPAGQTYTQVSQSNFLVGQIDDFGPNPDELFGFFPGIVPGFDNRVVPLYDLFPELASIDIDAITSAASVRGNLYLTVSGSDGLYLFGARDPSVPEPTTALLLLIGLPILLRRNR